MSKIENQFHLNIPTPTSTNEKQQLSPNEQNNLTASTNENLEQASNISQISNEQHNNSQEQKDEYFNDQNMDFEKKLEKLHNQTMNVLLRSKTQRISKSKNNQNMGNSFVSTGSNGGKRMFRSYSIRNQNTALDSSFMTVETNQHNIHQNGQQIRQSLDSSFFKNSNQKNLLKESQISIAKSQRSQRSFYYRQNRENYDEREKRFFTKNNHMEEFEKGRYREFYKLISVIVMSNKKIMQSNFYKQYQKTYGLENSIFQ